MNAFKHNPSLLIHNSDIGGAVVSHSLPIRSNPFSFFNTTQPKFKQHSSIEKLPQKYQLKKQKEQSVSTAIESELCVQVISKIKNTFEIQQGQQINLGNTLKENTHCQFKNYRDIFSQRHFQTILKTICAFSNCQGGSLYLGISDIGTKHGLHLSSEQKNRFFKHISYMLQNDCNPRLNKYVKVVLHPVQNKTQSIIIRLDVKKVNLAFRLVTFKGHCYLRRLASSIRLSLRQCIEIIYSQTEQYQKLIKRLLNKQIKLEKEHYFLKEILQAIN